ncbi:hypothetical protein [Lewinella cohaerens]|uniref:hypothetical protein n=1 Tax=Lewinella cohaerens TaxID=70995 RepID=UPI00037AB487|nr:hypothetical protein [Lewinella cohaerens]
MNTSKHLTLFYLLSFILIFSIGNLGAQAEDASTSKPAPKDCPGPCPCVGNFVEMQVYYFGDDNVTIEVYRNNSLSILIQTFNNVTSGQLLTIDGSTTINGTLGNTTYFVITNGGNSCVESIYTRCPSNAWPGATDDLDVVGKTFGDLTVFSRTDLGNNFVCDLSSAAQDWHVGGNVVSADKNTLGTRNNESVVFLTNDEERGTITNTGDFGINTLAPTARLDVRGDAIIDETLDVNGVTTIHDGTSSASPVSGALVVAGGAGIGENLNVADNTRTGNDLAVGRDAVIGRNLDVTNSATIGDDASVGGNLTVGVDAQIGNDMNVLRDTRTGRDLTANRHATVGENLSVGGDAGIGQNLEVNGQTTLNGFTRVNSNARITNDLDLDGELIMGVGNSKRVADLAGDLLIENQSGNVIIEADNEEMMVISSTQVEVRRRLIVTGGADLAERFNVNTSEEVDAPAILPGMVLSIDRTQAGELTLSNSANDRAVAGIVSGAGDVETAMVFGQTGTIADGDVAVAITGRVYAYVDASYGAIEPGDLLTTSPTTGHAMKVTDYTQAQGAIIGKAMTSLDAGKGLVLVLISLQ